MRIFFCAVLFLLATCSPGPKYSKSDHYDGDKFHMPSGASPRGLMDFLEWRLFGERAAWPEAVANKNYKLPKLESGKAIITFVNHATFLIQLPGVTILTDPIFSQRAGPFDSFGPVKRVRAPGVELERLPPVDLVLISHNHYDHMDMESLKKLNAQFRPLFLVPLGDKRRLLRAGLQNVMELDWWNEQKVKDVTITFTPVHHWSSRLLFDRNESLWGGFFIDSPGLKLYFAGDTAYTPYFGITRERLGAPDVAFLPIGAYGPRWFMKAHHMNPEDSVMAHIDLETPLSFGMHFGTFQLSDEAYDQPLKDLRKAREKFRVSEESFLALDFGQSFLIP